MHITIIPFFQQMIAHTISEPRLATAGEVIVLRERYPSGLDVQFLIALPAAFEASLLLAHFLAFLKISAGPRGYCKGRVSHRVRAPSLTLH